MKRLVIIAIMTALMGGAAAHAQVGIVGNAAGPSPLGLTSPLGIGPASPVGATGIPLGATEQVSPGVSPAPAGASPLGTAVTDSSACFGFGGSVPQSSFGQASTTAGIASGIGTTTAEASSSLGGTPLGTNGSVPTASALTGLLTPTNSMFDGGVTAGTASGTCVSFGGATLAQPAASASSPTGMAAGAPVGRVGVPLGTTELGSGGLSPSPLIPTLNFSAPVASAMPTATSLLATPPSTTAAATPPMSLSPMAPTVSGSPTTSGARGGCTSNGGTSSSTC